MPPSQKPDTNASPLEKRLATHVRDFLTRLTSSFGDDSARDLLGFRTALVRLIRRGLPLKRGRPEDPLTDEALLMIAQGKTFAEVLRSRIAPGADPYESYLQSKRLAEALKRRRRKSTPKTKTPKPDSISDLQNSSGVSAATRSHKTRRSGKTKDFRG